MVGRTLQNEIIIYMKILITEQQYNKAIDKYLTFLFEPHEVKTSSDNPYSIFWVKDGNIIVEIEKPKLFWVKSEIWNEISSVFGLQYDEIQSVIKSWLEEHYKLEGLKPRYWV